MQVHETLTSYAAEFSRVMTFFTVAAGDETLQFLQKLSALTRCEFDEWSLVLSSDKPQASPELTGTRAVWICTCVFLTYSMEYFLFLLAYSLIASFNLQISGLFVFILLNSQ